ncbi:MAG: hypothetical protein JNK05_17695 [Myxococcales bacterium]|nr:hypothetical protein [Myxococcales bacterium]
MSFERTAIGVALALFARCSSANRRENTDVSARPMRSLERASQLSLTQVADASSALAASDEPPLVAPPAAPSGCTLERPVRSINVGEGPLSFATAAAGARSLLAISTAQTSTLYLSRSDGTLAVLAAPFGPATALSASGAAHTMVVTWTRSSASQRATPSIAIVDERDSVRAFAFEERYAPVMTEVLCARVDRAARCAFALTERDEFDTNQGADAARAVLVSTTLLPQQSSVEFERRPIVAGVRAAAVVNAARPAMTVLRDGGLARTLDDGGLASIDPATLELAAFGADTAAIELRASAPTTERCQPAQWALSLGELGAARRDSGESTIATMDARPRGARIRSTGADGTTPAALWLDAPQCSERLFVIRAHRRGETVALTSATEFDAASDRASLSLAWREGDRLRWARYRCP